MKYMGSKLRIAKYILPIMLAERGDRTWVEPFVGGGNIIDKVDGKRIGADANKWVIQALTSIRDHVDEIPKNNKEFAEEDYRKLRQSDDYKHKGLAGFTYSWGGKWLGGWARSDDRDDYVRQSYNNAVRQSPLLQGVELVHSDYMDLIVPDNSLIYCDPPYANASKYKDTTFDHDEFWQWCRDMAGKGHKVFVSEYTAPDDFICIWGSEIRNNLRKTRNKETEKLFIPRKFQNNFKSTGLEFQQISLIFDI